MLRKTSQLAGSCEYGNEPFGSIKGGVFLDQLSDCQLLKKDSAACSYNTIGIQCTMGSHNPDDRDLKL
jgi:hypothetical protein